MAPVAFWPMNPHSVGLAPLLKSIDKRAAFAEVAMRASPAIAARVVICVYLFFITVSVGMFVLI